MECKTTEVEMKGVTMKEKTFKIRKSYLEKLRKMTSDELLKTLDTFILARSLQGKKGEEGEERTELVQKTIVKIIFEKFPHVFKKEGFRKRFISEMNH